MATIRKISHPEYNAYLEGAETLMYGKVFRLPGSRILKLFYIKRTFSSACIRPYSLRFWQNAQRLSRLKIPTVEVLEIFKVRGERFSAVLYRDLPGITLRDYIKENPITISLGRDLGNFFARLHEHGVFFRSIHPNNILLLENGRFALIDIADMKIFRGPLGIRKRMRNFQHAARSEEDRRMFSAVLQPFFDAYAMQSGISGNDATKIHRLLEQLWNDSADVAQS